MIDSPLPPAAEPDAVVEEILRLLEPRRIGKSGKWDPARRARKLYRDSLLELGLEEQGGIHI